MTHSESGIPLVAWGKQQFHACFSIWKPGSSLTSLVPIHRPGRRIIQEVVKVHRGFASAGDTHFQLLHQLNYLSSCRNSQVRRQDFADKLLSTFKNVKTKITSHTTRVKPETLTFVRQLSITNTDATLSKGFLCRRKKRKSLTAEHLGVSLNLYLKRHSLKGLGANKREQQKNQTYC